MNNYTCTRCGAVKAMMNYESKAQIMCCDGNSPVEHLVGVHPSITATKAKVEVIQPTPPEAPKQQLQAAPIIFNPSNQLINTQVIGRASNTVIGNTPPAFSNVFTPIGAPSK